MHTTDFCSTIAWVWLAFRKSAFKHGLTVEAIEHAIDNWMFWQDDFNETPNVLLLGPDQAGNILEILAEPFGDELTIFHAMKARPQFLELLTEGKE
jgi:hypothetical protein